MATTGNASIHHNPRQRSLPISLMPWKKTGCWPILRGVNTFGAQLSGLNGTRLVVPFAPECTSPKGT